MKIAIPVEEKSMNANVCVSFGRTPYFLIYNTDTDTEKYIANSAADAQGGAGIKAAQMVIDENVKAVIIPRLGQNAADVLIAAEIEMFKSEFGSAKRNIELYKENKLSILKDIHPGFHGHGGM